MPTIRPFLYACIVAACLILPAHPVLGEEAGKSPDLPATSPAEQAEPLLERPDLPPACLEIVGQWSWFTGDVKHVHADGTMDNGGAEWTGAWTCALAADGDHALTFVLDWNNGTYIDRLTLSPDGARLSGGNQYGVEVWGERLAE